MASLFSVFRVHLLGIWIAFAADEWFRGLFMVWRWRLQRWERMGFVQPVRESTEQTAV